MNGDGLAAQAKGLPARSQMVLGLVLTWLLQPFLRFDDTQHGQQRGNACRRLLDQALGDVEAGPSATLVEDVASTEEQQLEEEPDGPGAFRVDFVDALAYALESGQGSERALGWCLQRVQASLYHAAEAGLAFEPPGLDGQVLEVVDILSGASSIDQELVARLQEVIATSRDQLVQKA
jgi:hypothetical protein